jgi:hypothetical protein
MSISISPELETRLRALAEAQGLTVETYLERLLGADYLVEEELEAAALEGLNSGEPLEAGPSYWEEKHRELRKRLGETSGS